MNDPSALHWFARFGVSETLIRRALSEATANGADDADLYFEHAVR